MPQFCILLYANYTKLATQKGEPKYALGYKEAQTFATGKLYVFLLKESFSFKAIRRPTAYTLFYSEKFCYNILIVLLRI